jgi:threonine dehydratase
MYYYSAAGRRLTPQQAPQVKVIATQGYGARVVLHGTTFDDAAAHARELQAATGAVFVHAFDDPDVIAGLGIST